MRVAIGIGVAISAFVILNELRFVGRTGLALVLIAITIVLLIYGAVLWNLAKLADENHKRHS